MASEWKHEGTFLNRRYKTIDNRNIYGTSPPTPKSKQVRLHVTQKNPQQNRRPDLADQRLVYLLGIWVIISQNLTANIPLMIFISCLISSLHSKAICCMRFTAFALFHANVPRITLLQDLKQLEEIQSENGKVSVTHTYFLPSTQI